MPFNPWSLIWYRVDDITRKSKKTGYRTFSSLESMQSASPSQRQATGTQRPFPHMNSSILWQVGFGQLFSSSPSSQSAVPSHTQPTLMHRPSPQRNSAAEQLRPFFFNVNSKERSVYCIYIRSLIQMWEFEIWRDVLSKMSVKTRQVYIFRFNLSSYSFHREGDELGFIWRNWLIRRVFSA